MRGTVGSPSGGTCYLCGCPTGGLPSVFLSTCLSGEGWLRNPGASGVVGFFQFCTFVSIWCMALPPLGPAGNEGVAVWELGGECRRGGEVFGGDDVIDDSFNGRHYDFHPRL